MTARVRVMSKGERPLRTIVSSMLVPAGPRRRSTTSARFMLSVGWPVILRMRSPARMPARAAGVSSIGETTFGTPSAMVSSMPSPPNSPRVSLCIWRYSFSSM